MPDYTTLGISYPLPADQIKAASAAAKLADDIKQLAVTANQAILTEGGRAKTDAIADATTKYGGLPARVTAVEAKNTAQDTALTQGLASAATDATGKANTAKTDAIADATTKYGGLPARMDGVESKNVTQDSRLDSAESKNTAQDGRLDHLEAVAPKVSNLALDTDGTPYFLAGSTQVHVIPDTDGNPYYITFGAASSNASGNIEISF